MNKKIGLISTVILSTVMFTGCQNMSPSDQRIGAAAGGALGGGLGNHVGGGIGAGLGAAVGAGVGSNTQGGSKQTTTKSAIGAGI
ncbi:DNA transfer protein p32, partial [Acinetobacter baumannii]